MNDAPCVMLIASPSLQHTPAFERAVALSKAQGLPLHIVAFDYVEGLAQGGWFNSQTLNLMRDDYLKAHRDWLAVQAASLASQAVTVTTEVIWEPTSVSAILDVVASRPVNMLVKDVDHESLVMRTMFTTLDLHLLYECSVPLHFVSRSAIALPGKIVAAVDPFHPKAEYRALNDRIIAQAIALGAQCNAQVHLLYAYDQSSPSVNEQGYELGSLLFSASLAEQLFEAQGETFRALADRHDVAIENRHLIMGNPAKVLRQFALAYEVDMVIVGRLNPLHAGKRVGSTVEHLLNNVPGSLLVTASNEPPAAL